MRVFGKPRTSERPHSSLAVSVLEEAPCHAPEALTWMLYGGHAGRGRRGVFSITSFACSFRQGVVALRSGLDLGWQSGRRAWCAAQLEVSGVDLCVAVCCLPDLLRMPSARGRDERCRMNLTIRPARSGALYWCGHR